MSQGSVAMTSEEEINTLKVYWDHFFKAETGTYEKSTWLDLFLSEFLIRLNEGVNPKELIKFCPVSGVVSLVGCELLCGIHRVTSSINTHYSVPLPTLDQPPAPIDTEAKPEESSRGQSTSLFTRTNQLSSAEILKKYLLAGVTWRCLVLLRALGVEGLSCCRQLSSVLIWLWGELGGCAEEAAGGPQPPLPAPTPRAPIHQLFSHRIWLKHKLNVGQGSTTNSPASSEKGSVTGRSRPYSQSKSENAKSKRKSTKNPESDNSSDTGESASDLQVFSRSLAVQVVTPEDDFQYFNSPLRRRSSNEYDSLYSDPFSSPRRSKPKPSDYINEKHQEIINSQITTYEFTLLITDLLQDLCKAESSLTGSEGSQISMQCINFSLRNLCALQFGSMPSKPNPYDSTKLSKIKVVLTELLIVALDKVLIHADLCAKLINNGILPMLLRILEDVVCKSEHKQNSEDNANEEDMRSESDNLLKFVFGVSYSIIAFFHCLLMQCRSIEKLREFTEQFKLYGECRQGELLTEAMVVMLRAGGAGLLVRRVVAGAGRLVSAMKRARGDVLHAAACGRARHRACRARVTAGAHHHHWALGTPRAAPVPGSCCVATLHAALAALLTHPAAASEPRLCERVLRVMLRCGACCCVPAAPLVEVAVRLAGARATAAPLCLRLLERTVYMELGGGALLPRAPDTLPCGVCEPERRQGWAFLVHYNALLQLDNDHAVLQAAVAHLRRMLPRCRRELRRELLSSVLYPAFIVARHRWGARHEAAAYFLAGACLGMFAALLPDATLAELFIRQGGLSYVLELLALPEFAAQCCSILEITIVVEILKLAKENSELGFYREVGSLTSVQMLIKSLSDATGKFYKIFRLKLPEEKFLELCDVSKEREVLLFGSSSSSRIIKTPTSEAEEKDSEDCIENYLDVLSHVSTFWGCVAKLCCNSCSLRAAVADALLPDSFALLKLLLHAACCPLTAEPELRVLVKLLEAVLTVHFAVADVTQGRSKDISCDVLRSALSGLPGGGASGGVAPGGGALRALCDALLKVAAVVPSQGDTMPVIKHVKMAPLESGAGSQSEQCSSSDDSSAASCRSDRSATPPPDLGYEADVELGNLETYCKHSKTRGKNSGSLSSDSGTNEGVGGAGGSSACSREAALSAELCAIIVELLASIIHKIASEDVVCASVTASAVSCVSRAAAALRSRRAPPALLPRLLPAARCLLQRGTPAELISSVLELLVVLLRGGAACAELRALLRLARGAALAHVLPVLAALADVPPNTPDYVLAYPVQATLDDSGGEAGVRGAGRGAAPAVTSHSLPTEHAQARYRDLHNLHGISSAWSRSAVRCGLEAGWTPWLQGAAVVAWLHVEQYAAPPGGSEFHVVSLGHDSLMFEFWIDVADGSLIFKLSRGEANSAGILRACRVSAALQPRVWSCVVLSVCEAQRSRKLHVQVTPFVNGYEFETVLMPLQGILVRKPQPLSVLLGASQPPPPPPRAAPPPACYQLAHVFVLRAPVTMPQAMHLAARGPDHHCQMKCETLNFSHVLTPQVLEMDIDWDQVFELSGPPLLALQHNLLLTFGAHSPDIINLYHPTLPSQAVFPSAAGGPSIPEALFPRAAAPHCVTATRTALAAMRTFDEPPLTLALYVRVIELGGNAAQQAAALQIMLQACGRDAALHRALLRCFDMLCAAMRSPAALLVPATVQVIMQAACSAAVLCGDGSIRAAAALLQPALLPLLLRAASLPPPQEVEWQELGEGRQRGSLWALALACVWALVREDNPHRAFNLYQMTRVDLLRELLLLCKERYLNSESGPMEPAALRVLALLVRALVGAPPQLDRLAAVLELLLLLHQASDTFVTHSRANFYFLVSAAASDASDFNLFRKKPRRSRAAAPPRDVASGDCTKQGGEEDRVHKGSSTSENSDVPVESEPGEASLDALKDYIVVEEDEVKHGTVEVYSSGIYHQQRVGLGASDGAWCAALLLLLRDAVPLVASAHPHHQRVGLGASDGAWCAALLLLLRDAVPLVASAHPHHTVLAVLQPEMLTVLAQHRSARVRAALVRLVGALLRCLPKAPPPCLPLLAAQISLYPGSDGLMSACASLITKCDVPLEDQFNEDIWRDVREEAWARAGPLLALAAGEAAAAPRRAAAALQLLHKLAAQSSLKSLNNACVVEVCVRCVQQCATPASRDSRAPRDPCDSDSRDSRDAHDSDSRELLAAVAALLQCVLTKALHTNHAMQTVVDIHLLLYHAEGVPGAAGAARATQAALFGGTLRQLAAALGAATPQHSYFTSVLSSAVSLGTDTVSRAELAARHLSTCQRALRFVTSAARYVSSDARYVTSDEEDELTTTLLHTLLMATSPSRPRHWASSSEWASMLVELLWWVLAPGGAARARQPAVLRLLAKHSHVTRISLPSHSARKLAVYVLSMVQHLHLAAERGAGVEPPLTDWARDWALQLQAALPGRVLPERLPHDARVAWEEDGRRFSANVPQHAQVAKAVFARESLAQKMTESAMLMTRQVVEQQNSARKAFMEQLRRQLSLAASAAQRWAARAAALAHPRGIWHSADSWPAGWRLDATEGPGRVRLRLVPAHLNVPRKFLKPQHKHKAEAPLPPPLASAVSAGGCGGLVARLQLHECVSFMTQALYCTCAAETRGELLLSDRCIHFVPEDVVPEEAVRSQGGAPHSLQRAPAQSWPLHTVLQVAPRRWCLQERAVELFLSSGHAQLLAFRDPAERQAFLRALDHCHLPNRTEPESLAEAMNQWRNGQITNWEYLMRLNGLGGRSYNDLMQYPVFPFIIADYTSRILDLNDPKSFRDLSKPMAVQNKSREQHYINCYNDLAAAARDGCGALLARRPHHYASLYSNSGAVLHYLVRVSPFTELLLNYQDNNFDMPDRTFHSLATTWRLITNDSPTDVKELIPELFYLPELFHNTQGLALGRRQCGASVDSVALPPWAADSRLFTLIHRQALEAAHVSDNIAGWVDLVFGYKQVGQPAIDAINVFPACTYYGFDPSVLEDEVERSAGAAMVRTYGQAPRQLLRAPHPRRAVDLLHTDTPQPEVVSGVAGARWGRYCGSPALRPAGVRARRRGAGGPLQPLPAPRQVAAPRPRHAAVRLPDKSDGLVGGVGGGGGSLALVSWGHSDHALRVKRRRDLPPALLLHVPPSDPISCVTTSISECACPLFLGLWSGRVLACTLGPGGAGDAGGGARCGVRVLYAHGARVAAVAVSVRASTLVTADVQGVVVLWDLNTLQYIRTLPNRQMLSVTHVTISDTLSDVATVHDPSSPHESDVTDDVTADVTCDMEEDAAAAYENDAYKYSSLIRVHTVNGKFVGSVKVCELVTCVCYSGAPEGVSVNSLAAGLDSGGVRLYSSWDLRTVNYIPPAASGGLISLTYSSDSSILFGCYSEGTVVAWESGEGGEVEGRGAGIDIIPAHALF